MCHLHVQPKPFVLVGVIVSQGQAMSCTFLFAASMGQSAIVPLITQRVDEL